MSEVCDEIKERKSIRDYPANQYVSTENLVANRGGFQPSQEYPITTEGIGYKEGDILVSNIRPYLKKIWLAHHDGVCSSDVVVFRTKDNVTSAFLFQLLSADSFFDYVMSNAVGTKMPRGDRKVMQDYPIVFPAIIDEQRKITEALSNLDSNIELTHRLITKYESIKKTTVKKLMMPTRDWQTTTIENIADVVTGATPSTSVPEYWDNATIPWMSSGEINNRFITYTENRISQLGYSRTSTHLIRPNSVLVALAGQGTTRGKVAINRIELCTNQSLAAITPFRSEDYGFVFWNLDSRYNELRSISTGDGGRGGLNLHLIKTLPIQLPDEKTRDSISTQLFSLSQLEDELHNQMLKLKDIKQSMMQYFFG